jgi:hypothetical protein
VEGVYCYLRRCVLSLSRGGAMYDLSPRMVARTNPVHMVFYIEGATFELSVALYRAPFTNMQLDNFAPVLARLMDRIELNDAEERWQQQPTSA